MVKEIIFLSHDYMDMIEAAKINKDDLVSSKIKDVLSRSDIRAIEQMTNKAYNQKLLQYYGFNDNCDCSGLSRGYSNSNSIIDPELDKPLYAHCPNQNSIIVWQGERDESCSRNLFRENLKNILKAMTRVMSFDDVVKSDQFELLIMRA